MKELPPRQKETYEYIKQFIASHGYSPTQDEIGQHFMVTQVAVLNCLRALKQKGHVNYMVGKSRTITIVK